jgi:hypothetical protein
MDKQCDNCPFASKGAGLALRRSLKPGRWAEITQSIRDGAPFHCHKTTQDMVEDDDGDVLDVGAKALMCAGALAYAEKRGVSSQLQRVCERLDSMRKRV